MSETILDHGYVPEEHAPDPVVSHGDPTPPGKIAIWLFLASEVMFFVAILGSYIILRSGEPAMFAKFGETLSKPLAGLNTLVLIFSSLTMALAVDASQKGNRNRVIVCLAITFICACGFMVIKTIEYYDKWTHYTIAYRDGSMAGTLYIIDGHAHHQDAQSMQIEGTRKAVTSSGADIHMIAESDLKAGGEHGEFTIPRANIVAATNYFPWKNIFFSSYFTLTGVHGLHVVGGMFPILFLTIFALRGRLLPAHTEYVGLYWHFVDLVWIFLFPLLYLI